MADRTTYVALLRGVNVGGNARLRMADLRELVGSLGYGGVATYIQSGNVTFTAVTGHGGVEAESRVAAGIHDSLKTRLGLDVEVMVRSRADVERALAEVPFPITDPKRLIVAFLAGPPSAEAIRSVEAIDAAPEQVQVVGRVAYLDLPDGVGRSILAPVLERRLKVRTTARNLSTVRALLALMDAGPG